MFFDFFVYYDFETLNRFTIYNSFLRIESLFSQSNFYQSKIQCLKKSRGRQQWNPFSPVFKFKQLHQENYYGENTLAKARNRVWHSKIFIYWILLLPLTYFVLHVMNNFNNIYKYWSKHLQVTGYLFLFRIGSTIVDTNWD